jgi:hypothetical protein
LLQASDGEIQLTTTDLDVGIRGSVAAQVERAGATTLPARRLFKTESNPAILAPLADPPRRAMREPNIANPKAWVTKLTEVNARCSRILFIFNAFKIFWKLQIESPRFPVSSYH